ncbi:methyltransferase [Streptomyces yaizuensis]|uniref:Methyltransferase n=1 Tax=Streptomyces yaizuensis TaxID=2989713 RepID=A0ABQ5NYR0_9ACTN|nr:methyltransferase [Streptomyces sp. YSPA8]GLF95500.1 methyltransferase [Streptomyces sp. YSPA8]
MSTAGQEEPDLRSIYHASGPWTGQTLYVAAHLGLADLLDDDPRGIGDIAKATASDEDALYRFCRALTALGMLAEHPGRSFTLRQAGRALRRDAADGFRDGVLLQSGAVFRAWADVLHTVRTGRPAFDHALGMDYFEFLAANPEEARVFNRAMGATMPAAIAALEHYAFGTCATVVDVGGGDGRLLASVLSRHPGMHGVLQDLPGTVSQAGENLSGVADRCTLVGESFFDAVATGGDVYILSRVLHDWDDDNAGRILRRVREAMPAHGRLILVESVLRPADGDLRSVLGDLLMLVVLGGRERTESEWAELLESAGFTMRQVWDDPGLATTRGHSVIEAVARAEADRPDTAHSSPPKAA